MIIGVFWCWNTRLIKAPSCTLSIKTVCLCCAMNCNSLLSTLSDDYLKWYSRAVLRYYITVSASQIDSQNYFNLDLLSRVIITAYLLYQVTNYTPHMCAAQSEIDNMPQKWFVYGGLATMIHINEQSIELSSWTNLHSFAFTNLSWWNLKTV